MPTSGYDALRMAHKAVEEREKKRLETLQQTKERKSQELRKQNAHGYPALEKVHRELAGPLKAERERQEKSETAKAQITTNAYEIVKEAHGRAASNRTKPAQVARPPAAAPPHAQPSAGGRGDLQPTPFGSAFPARDDYNAIRRTKSEPAKGEMTTVKTARAGKEASVEMTEAGSRRQRFRTKLTESLKGKLAGSDGSVGSGNAGGRSEGR